VFNIELSKFNNNQIEKNGQNPSQGEMMSLQRTYSIDLNLLAICTLNGQQPALLDNALQEERTILMLNQTLEVIERLNNDVQAEYIKTLEQAQETVLNLQKAQQSLVRENAQWQAQVTVLESHNNQMNIVHQADIPHAARFVTFSPCFFPFAA
jgi:hypothetical protein